jgi:hypothetical protein
MIPMSFLLLAWFILVAIFVLFALLTLAVHIRFGISNALTTISAGIFLGVSIFIIFAAGIYFLQVDWKQNVGFIELAPFGTQESVSEFEL